MRELGLDVHGYIRFDLFPQTFDISDPSAIGTDGHNISQGPDFGNG
jgi:hypothetical protein